ncbi:MAG TPA: hypothetical protein VIL12_03865 [Acidimicrobiia bacterium]
MDRRSSLWWIIGSLLVVSCASQPTPTTAVTPPGADAPRAAVEGLRDALAASDFEATSRWVDEVQIVLLASIEGISTPETLTMLTQGLTPDVRSNFWEAFVEGFPVFAHEEISELLIGDETLFELGGSSFAAVQITLRQNPGIGSLIVRREGGRWLVDLFATVGPSLASPLRKWLETVPDDEQGRLIRAEVAAQQPSFESALAQQPLGAVSDGARFEIQLLIVEANS